MAQANLCIPISYIILLLKLLLYKDTVGYMHVNQDAYKEGSTLRSIGVCTSLSYCFLKNNRELEQINKINHCNNANNRDKKDEKRNPWNGARERAWNLTSKVDLFLSLSLGILSFVSCPIINGVPHISRASVMLEVGKWVKEAHSIAFTASGSLK